MIGLVDVADPDAGTEPFLSAEERRPGWNQTPG
jgi:hypothetical protein